MKKSHVLIIALAALFMLAGCDKENNVSNVYRAEISDYHYASPLTGNDIQSYLSLFNLWNGTDMTLKGATTEITDLEAIGIFNSSLLLINADSVAAKLGENDSFTYQLSRKESETASAAVLRSVTFTSHGLEQAK
jgi:hypothetical protein